VPFCGVIDAPAFTSAVVWLNAPLAAESLVICVAVASVALVMTYVPGVATVPDTVDAAIAPEFDEVGLVAVKAVGSLTAWNVSWNFATRSWIFSISAC